METTQSTPSGFWIRFAAILIDGVLIGIVNSVIMAPLLGQTFMLAAASEAGTINEFDIAAWFTTFVISNIAVVVLGWLYFSLMESSSLQGTLGKKLVGIKVTDMNGGRIGFARATGRYFGKILSSIILMVGYIMAAFTEKKQALHDMLAGTLVVNR